MLYLRWEKSDILKYWIKSKDKTFKLYCIYKLLSLDKYYKKKDYKENIAFIYYLVDLINRSQEKILDKKKINTKFKMEINNFNEYKIDIKEEEFVYYNIQYNKKILINNYNKLAIFCLDNNDNEKYILQDIIDVSEIIRKNNPYRLKLNKDVYFVPFFKNKLI